jgi:hypothetical protein
VVLFLFTEESKRKELLPNVNHANHKDEPKPLPRLWWTETNAWHAQATTNNKSKATIASLLCIRQQVISFVLLRVKANYRTQVIFIRITSLALAPPSLHGTGRLPSLKPEGMRGLVDIGSKSKNAQATYLDVYVICWSKEENVYISISV